MSFLMAVKVGDHSLMSAVMLMDLCWGRDGRQLQRAREGLCSSAPRKWEKDTSCLVPEFQSALWKGKLGTVPKENAVCGLVQQGV